MQNDTTINNIKKMVAWYSFLRVKRVFWSSDFVEDRGIAHWFLIYTNSLFISYLNAFNFVIIKPMGSREISLRHVLTVCHRFEMVAFYRLIKEVLNEEDERIMFLLLTQRVANFTRW